MTQDVELRTALTPEEADTGNTDQGVHEHNEERVERSPEAEGNERRHGEAYNKTDCQPKEADGGNRSHRVQACGM